LINEFENAFLRTRDILVGAKIPKGYYVGPQVLENIIS
jgi:hypothetical protein